MKIISMRLVFQIFSLVTGILIGSRIKKGVNFLQLSLNSIAKKTNTCKLLGHSLDMLYLFVGKHLTCFNLHLHANV